MTRFLQTATYGAGTEGEPRPGQSPGGPGDRVTWVNARLDQLDPEERRQAVAPLEHTLKSLCPGLHEELLGDLVVRDLWPKVSSYGANDRVRTVSAATIAKPDPGAVSDSASMEGTPDRALAFQLVELAAGDGWIVSCWHDPKLYRGAEEVAWSGTCLDHGGLSERVDQAHQDGRIKTAGDLGLLILQEAADSYTGALRSLYDWLEDWELDFYQRSGAERDAEVDRQPLIDLRALVYQSRKCLSAINAPQAKVQTFWFADVADREAAERLDQTIDRTLRRLTELSDRMRSAFDVAQLQLAELQGRRTERLQQKFDLVAAVLLVPTLIAGMYGANTDFPGRESEWGTVLMLLLMVLGGIATYAVLRLHRRR